MENKEVEKKQWEYIMPDGSKEYNMKDAKIKLGVSKSRLVGMLKSGLVNKVEIIDSKPLKGYEQTNGTMEFSWC